jgi:purine-binding chemotaxis protein CheW
MPGSAKSTLEAILFEVGGQRYGLPAADVREVARAVTMARLPRAPAIVEGVVNVRGMLVGVLDIRARFRLAPKGLEPTDHLIVAQAGSRVVALRVDRVVDLVRLDAGQIGGAEQAVPGVGYVAGVARTDDGLVLIHDLRTFLSEAEALSLDEALTSGAGAAR